MNLLAAGSNSRKRVGCRSDAAWTRKNLDDRQFPQVIVLVVPGSAASIAFCASAIRGSIQWVPCASVRKCTPSSFLAFPSVSQ